MSGMLLLPLDDRPVNLDTPCLLAAVAGETLHTPPPALLGRFLQPGQPDALLDWLARAAPEAETAIVALDMLAYGGLVASRTPAVALPDALRRLDALREIKRQHPHLRLLAFNVIMRLTITGADAETRAAGRAIFRYSMLRDQAERLGDAAAADELPRVIARIPPALLDAYLAARARNHAVNQAALALLADGVLDFLALVQEDTAPTGLHLSEQQALVELARARVAPERWRLYAGTDEAAQTLLARAVGRGTLLPVVVTLRDARAAESPALYEDVPLRRTIERHVDAAGGVPAAHGVILAAHTFTPPQQDLFEMPPLPAPTWEAALAAFPAGGVGAWVAGLGQPLAVADLAYCNGGDPHLLDALFTHKSVENVYSYAGWNTAGNTLGTTLAHAALRAAALSRGVTPAMEAAHRAALLVRVLDDGLYQTVVRAWVMARVQESGGSALNLGMQARPVADEVAALMQSLWRAFRERYPRAAALDRPFRVELPWGRLFEIRIVL